MGPRYFVGFGHFLGKLPNFQKYPEPLQHNDSGCFPDSGLRMTLYDLLVRSASWELPFSYLGEKRALQAITKIFQIRLRPDVQTLSGFLPSFSESNSICHKLLHRSRIAQCGIDISGDGCLQFISDGIEIFQQANGCIPHTHGVTYSSVDIGWFRNSPLNEVNAFPIQSLSQPIDYEPGNAVVEDYCLPVQRVHQRLGPPQRRGARCLASHQFHQRLQMNRLKWVGNQKAVGIGNISCPRPWKTYTMQK